MNELEIIELCRQAILVILKLAGPLMLAGLIIGVAVAILQTTTQIQEQSLTFVPKLLTVFLVAIWLLPFMIATMSGFTHSLSDKIVQVGRQK
ncbi:MAG: flagellar type III secretion system protein FliQ [Alphaproteobacteria bacterium]|nr:flagellar type III secretion system protein FliQ [Alphaproteobacteria bacterium]MCL2504752.1 flagellar type III secretion system protein FliQ [Alphaproteobacteria bacterium]